MRKEQQAARRLKKTAAKKSSAASATVSDAVLLSTSHANRIDQALDPNCEDLELINALLSDIKQTEFRQVCAKSSKFKSQGLGEETEAQRAEQLQVPPELIASINRSGVPAGKLAQVRQKLKAHSYGTQGQDPMKVFKHFDRDNSGELDFGEFRAAVRKVGHMTAVEISDSEVSTQAICRCLWGFWLHFDRLLVLTARESVS